MKQKERNFDWPLSSSSDLLSIFFASPFHQDDAIAGGSVLVTYGTTPFPSIRTV